MFLYLNWFKSYAIIFDPIRIQKRSALQNDHLNISFVKDTYVNDKKMARKVGKMVIYESQISEKWG